MKSDQVPNVPINGQAWQRLAIEVRRFLAAEGAGGARILAGLLIVLTLGISGLNVVNSYVGRDFMTAIEHRDPEAFVAKAIAYVGVFLLATVVAVLYRYSEERLGLLWRERLTRRLIDRYLARKIYFRLDSERRVSNPDQRIAEDVRAFTTTTLSFALMFLNAGIAVLAFSGVLWSISPLLFIVAVIYALSGSYLTIALGRSLVGLNYNQLDKEANFRSDLIHVRENAEAVALLNRERRLKSRLITHLDDLINNFRLIILVNRNLGFFTTGYNNLVQVIPALIVAPLFMSGAMEFGVITQSAMAFAHLIGAFSLIVTNFQSISSFAAVVTRLGLLEEAIEEVGMAVSCQADVGGKTVEETCRTAQGPTIVEGDGHVAFDDLTLCSPVDGRTLIKRLNLSLLPGQRVLILSTSDVAKLALFRATAGMWDCGAGNIVRPLAGRMQFLPERPYMPPGTLRELLVHTGQEEQVSDEQIRAVLAALELEPVLDRSQGLYTQKDWDNILSLSEQQLLAFARVFLAAPDAVFLDRVSSALNPDEVALVLNMLRDRGITYLMLGRSRHGRRETDDKLEHYDAILELDGSGGWKWKAIREGRFVDG